MKWVLYNLLFALAYPFLLPGFIARMLRRGGYAARMGDRFALYPDGVRAALVAGRGRLVWIHAVSVGEVQVAGQLMREWRKAEPDVSFCFSTTSSTGWRTAEREVTDRDILIYNPLDFPNFVKSALLTAMPRAIVLTESEIWPNFIRQAKKMGVPVFLVNARVSDRSAPRYRAARWFFRDVLSSFARIFAQSDLDAERLLAAGAPRDVVEVTGSFKFDVARRNPEKERELREWIGPGRILLGGSTWPGEDKALLKIYSDIVKGDGEQPSDLKLVIAPRHFEKADAVEENIRSAGFGCVRRSRGDANPAISGHGNPNPVFLADTTGELMGLYGIADAVFVGKSLCAHGSQNMIEPCLCGKPTAVGPYTENFRPVMSDLLAADAIVQVEDERGLGEFLAKALKDDGGLGTRAAAAVERRCGVVPRCIAAMRGLLASVAMLLFVAGCGSGEGDAQISEPEEGEFTPVKIVTASIAAVENPFATRALLYDDKAEAYRQYISAFGFICVSNVEASAVTRFSIVFLAGRADAAALTNAASRVGERGILAWRLNVKDMKAKELKPMLESFPFRDAHLWMPGEEDWVVVGRREAQGVRLGAMLDAFSREGAFEMLAEAKATALSDVFASYAGPLSDAMGAFAAGNLDAVVKPEFFITKEIPPPDWISQDDVDGDIFRETLAEMRSMQVVRRLILEGRMLADSGKVDDSTATWARAMLRNPRDTMLLERLDRLGRNASAFLRIGNVAAAANCYETIIVVNPKDASAVFNYGVCLKRLGKKDLSRQVLERAKEMGK